MADAAGLTNTVEACMFDRYGFVVDMGGSTACVTPFLKAKGWTVNPNSFVTWWRGTHFENAMIDALPHREHTPDREIGHLTAQHYHGRPFDGVISVAEAGSCKPHVDIGAKAAGLRTAFIDRRGGPVGETPCQPNLLLSSMKDLADAIV